MLEVNGLVGMPGVWQELFEQICYEDLQAGGIDARMTADIFTLQDLSVDDKVHSPWNE